MVRILIKLYNLINITLSTVFSTFLNVLKTAHLYFKDKNLVHNLTTKVYYEYLQLRIIQTYPKMKIQKAFLNKVYLYII